MSLSNTTLHYGGVAKVFHWLTALLILTLIPLGWYAHQLPYETDVELARKAWLFSAHKTLGVAAFFVALGRIIWAITQPKPGLLNADKPLESTAAEIVHWMLYGALVIVPLSGWIAHAAAAGFAPIWWPFGQGLPMVPKSTAVEHFFGTLHWVSGRVLILSLMLHIAGALKHHIIDRDATLRRMLPGTTQVEALPQQPHSWLPVLGAVALWAGALVLAAGMPGGDPAQDTADDAALTAVASDWAVQEGSVEITVVQFGSEVTGSFADWTSAIEFDESIETGTLGHVTTTIAINSLSLGSVTQQAMEADFFDVARFATAVFDAELRHAGDGYEAAGSLTIKDQTVPLVMPFSLSIDGDLAQMRGDLQLDRRDFAIGDNMQDASSLAFEVTVAIRLTAQRQAAE